MTIDQVVQVVQASFPQVYLACHTRHQRKRTTEHRLSARDSSILAHLDEQVPMTPARLSAHLGIARSTLSEALKHLIALGYARRAGAAAASPRTTAVLLTPKGSRAIRDTSVLETERLRIALESLSPNDLRVVASGMSRLAAACRTLGKPDRFGRSA
jgi:MarR family transcriptional regulator, organic hydroperoxide resistance regulator